MNMYICWAFGPPSMASLPGVLWAKPDALSRGVAASLQRLAPATGWTEAALTALAGTGFTGSEKLDTIVLINGHARSLAQHVASMSENGELQFTEQFAEMMTAASGRYPEVQAAFAEEAAAAAGTGGPNDALRFGVDRILDGLAVLIDQRN
ncbi:hypothetical protein ACTWPB_12395 [Nocardia sp. IBHARD005]|uniref:hypothetical protein n=1 Tax=Nocardia sp. IBHARD005 TaxID=3457765 RepID=UPI0040596722